MKMLSAFLLLLCEDERKEINEDMKSILVAFCREITQTLAK